MPNVSLVDIGKLSKPATVLVEKISNAIGIVYEPRRIKQKAIAEAEASKTKALMDLEIEEIQKRTLNRLVAEEIKKQENIESITEKSFDSLKENASPENIEDDWISNFFDKCKLISDEEMQKLWAQILAGESNNPGTFSKRTLKFLETLDKSEAVAFIKLSSITVKTPDGFNVFFDNKFTRTFANKLTGSNGYIDHFISIGLIYSDTYAQGNSDISGFKFNYRGTDYELIGPKKPEHVQGRITPLQLPVSFRMLTLIGNQLLEIAGSNKNENFICGLKESFKKEVNIDLKESANL